MSLLPWMVRETDVPGARAGGGRRIERRVAAVVVLVAVLAGVLAGLLPR